jgi:hypothetical protein
MAASGRPFLFSATSPSSALTSKTYSMPEAYCDESIEAKISFAARKPLSTAPFM